MANNRSNYAGLAAAAVFLVGLIILGNAAVRIAALALIIFATVLAVSPTQSRRFLTWAIAVAVCSAMVAYKAVSFQVSGEATYFDGHGRFYMGTELVTREGSPVKFGQAMKEVWAACICLALISGIFFTFHRKLRRAEYAPDL